MKGIKSDAFLHGVSLIHDLRPPQSWSWLVPLSQASTSAPSKNSFSSPGERDFDWDG